MTASLRSPQLWIDVTTLLLARGATSGIPRTLAQLLHHWRRTDPRPRLWAFDRAFGVCREVAWDDSRLAGDAKQQTTPSLELYRKGGNLIRRIARNLTRPLTRALGNCLPETPAFAPGDVLLFAGANWQEYPAALVDRLRQQCSLRVAQLIYDITPVRCPNLCSPSLHADFAGWLPDAIRRADVVLTISDYSRRDLLQYCEEHQLTCPPVEIVRLGDEPGATDSVRRPDLPSSFRSFALFVSSVARHKNQELLLEVWRRLVRQHGSAAPGLVLVGAPGHEGQRILDRLAKDDELASVVCHRSGASDDEVRWLYRHCQFTLFPSHYEGWGLPVAESLIHGKVCIASRATALPEVGGGLVEYHDPDDSEQCYQLVERASLDPDWLAAREQSIRERYQITPWADCAAQTAAILERHLGTPTPGRARVFRRQASGNASARR